MALTGSSTECWTKLDECTSGMTVSIWYKPDVLNSGHSFIAGSGGSVQNAFSLYVFDRLMVLDMIVYTSTGRFYANAQTKAVADVWILITGTYDSTEGATMSINGVFEHKDTQHDNYIESVEAGLERTYWSKRPISIQR